VDVRMAITNVTNWTILHVVFTSSYIERETT
jgi:hypothetical protein